MNNIFITGSSGFVGSNLIPYLTNRSYTTFGVTRNPDSDHMIDYQELFKGRINEAFGIVHLAGIAHDTANKRKESLYFEVNTHLTEQLFDAFLKSRCCVFIFISSVKAVRDKVETVLTETTTTDPKSVYGKSKLAAENYIRNFNVPEGKRVYILRPCLIHGTNNKGNLRLLFQIIRNGLPYPLGQYHNERSYLSIENFCFVIDSLLSKRLENGIYNVADEGYIGTEDVIRLMAETMGIQPKIWNVPRPIVELLAKFGDTFSLPFTTERLVKLTENYRVDSSKLKKGIGADFPIKLKDGLIKTFKSMY